MRTTSILLTIALLIPVIGNLFFAFQYYLLSSHRMLGQPGSTFMFRSYAAPLLGDFIFIVLALILNVKQKYYENSIMCATRVGAYILFMILNFASNFLFNWLK